MHAGPAKRRKACLLISNISRRTLNSKKPDVHKTDAKESIIQCLSFQCMNLKLYNTHSLVKKCPIFHDNYTSESRLTNLSIHFFPSFVSPSTPLLKNDLSIFIPKKNLYQSTSGWSTPLDDVHLLHHVARGYGVELFGVSVTTLEEVFLRVGRDHTEADVAADERLQQVWN